MNSTINGGRRKVKFGDNLKKLRKMYKMSQENLAEKMNISRQSVSKWETGETYPEMNNILELCKIFHCQINELINNNTIDFKNFDEKTKSSVVKLKKEQQNRLKLFSKGVIIGVDIDSIILIIVLCSVVFRILATPLLVYMGNEIIKSDYMQEYYKGNEIEEMKPQKIDIWENVKIILYILPIMITLILGLIMLKYVKKLFKNIHNGSTPFTLENVLYIKKISRTVFIMSFVGILSNLFSDSEYKLAVSGGDFILMLVIYCFYYIFLYGYNIQLDSNGIIYEEVNASEKSDTENGKAIKK